MIQWMKDTSILWIETFVLTDITDEEYNNEIEVYLTEECQNLNDIILEYIDLNE